MITASQLRAGTAIRYEGQLYKVLFAEYHPGQGKMGGVTHVRVKNLSTGTLWEHSFRADLKLEEAPFERRPMDFLYEDSEQCYFMDTESYEQIGVPSSLIGPQSRFLLPEMSVLVEFADGQPVSVVFPEILEVRIVETAPAAHQQQETVKKTARLENGIEIMVPQFIKSGDIIRLDVENLRYIDRVKSAAKG